MTSFPFTKIRKEKDIDPTAEHCIYVYIGKKKKTTACTIIFLFWLLDGQQFIMSQPLIGRAGRKEELGFANGKHYFWTVV